MLLFEQREFQICNLKFQVQCGTASHPLLILSDPIWLHDLSNDAVSCNVFVVSGFVSGHTQWQSIVAPHCIKHKSNNILSIKNEGIMDSKIKIIFFLYTMGCVSFFVKKQSIIHTTAT